MQNLCISLSDNWETRESFGDFFIFENLELLWLTHSQRRWWWWGGLLEVGNCNGQREDKGTFRSVVKVERKPIRSQLEIQTQIYISRWEENQFEANWRSKPNIYIIPNIARYDQMIFQNCIWEGHIVHQLLDDIVLVDFSVDPFEEKNPLPLPSNKASGLRGCH